MCQTNNKNKMNHMNENENKDIKSLVLEKIQSGKINMRPRFYFVLKVISLAFVAVLILLISSLLISFIIFSLAASGKMSLLGFGTRGFLMFFVLFPWPLLIVEIALIILLEWLIKKFRFGYRSSLSRLVFVILLISIAISLMINITPLHNTLQNRAEHRDLPFVGDYYRGIRRPPPNQEIFRGTVSSVSTSSFVLDGKYVINLPPNTSQLLPSPGDTVFVAGQLMPDGKVRAFGFQKFSISGIE